VGNEDMKEYVIEVFNKSKGNSYALLKKDEKLMDILDRKYPHISDLIIKVQLYIRDLDDSPTCRYTGCNNKVSYKHGIFQQCCSRKCALEYKKENGFYEELSNKLSEKSKNRSPEEKQEILEKIKKTNRRKFGSDFYLQSKEAKISIYQSNIEKYGTQNPLKLAWQQYNTGIVEGKDLRYMIEKIFETNMKKYGSKTFMETKDFRNKSKETILETYGTEYYVQTDEFKNKSKETHFEKYGVEVYSQTDEYKEKYKNTILENYGVDHYSKTDEYKEKYKNTMLENYGVDHYSKTDEFKEKCEKTSLENYGKKTYLLTDEFKEKYKNAMLENYGVEHPMQNDAVKEKIRQTSLERYGVEHPNKKGYNSEFFGVFNDVKNFEVLLNLHGTSKLADLINCDVSTIHKFASNNNIVLPARPKSYQEEIVTDFLIQNDIPFISNTKKILPSGKELDFYFPDHNLAVEINGIYYHSEINGGKDKTYHYNKWKECDDLGITLLSIHEDEFSENKQFWFNKLLYMTGKLSLTKIHARKCEVRELDNVTEFLNHHHLQGYCASSIKLGLFVEGILVSVMTFSKPRDNKNGVIDLSRFCNHSGYIVSGGASKLLKYFIKNYGDEYQTVISFSDNNYSNGNVYEKLGFVLNKNVPPDYKYVMKGKRYHKAGFRKDRIFGSFDIPDTMKDATEWELMQYLGYDRIWDTGKKKWEMKFST
jgi:hypothetical protein